MKMEQSNYQTKLTQDFNFFSPVVKKSKNKQTWDDIGIGELGKLFCHGPIPTYLGQRKCTHMV